MSEPLADGDTCPECNEGVLEYEPVVDCSCHISPPCNKCIDNPLVCNQCGWEDNGN